VKRDKEQERAVRTLAKEQVELDATMIVADTKLGETHKRGTNHVWWLFFRVKRSKRQFVYEINETTIRAARRKLAAVVNRRNVTIVQSFE
jgi:hypothetical protein